MGDYMSRLTTIQLEKSTKNKLEKLKEYKRETYDELVNKLIEISEFVNAEPELKEEFLEEIEDARKEIKAGKGISTEKLLKELGIKL